MRKYVLVVIAAVFALSFSACKKQEAVEEQAPADSVVAEPAPAPEAQPAPEAPLPPPADQAAPVD